MAEGYHRAIDCLFGGIKAMKATKPDAKQQAYDAWYDEQIKLGLDDLDAERVVSHAEFLKHTADLMRKLERKHDQAA